MPNDQVCRRHHKTALSKDVLSTILDDKQQKQSSSHDYVQIFAVQTFAVHERESFEYDVTFSAWFYSSDPA
jgi:hypothetical protein